MRNDVAAGTERRQHGGGIGTVIGRSRRQIRAVAMPAQEQGVVPACQGMLPGPRGGANAAGTVHKNNALLSHPNSVSPQSQDGLPQQV